jgi:hypothetical protein
MTLVDALTKTDMQLFPLFVKRSAKFTLPYFSQKITDPSAAPLRLQDAPIA